MIRGNSFTVKSTFSLLLFLTSLFCFSISYQEISRIKLNYDLGFQENINYFDKKAFQKYYEKIEIQNLTDPIFDEKKSKNYFRDISFSNLLSLFDDETLKESAPKVIDDNLKEEKIVEKVNDLIEEEKFSYQDINVSKGDNFAKILKKGGLRGRDIDNLIINGADVYDFSKIYQGDIIKIFSKYDDNNSLTNFELIYRFSKIEELFISFLEDKFIYEIKKYLLLPKRYLYLV